MADINLAWEILQDEETRHLYDEARASGAQWIPTGKKGDGIRRTTRRHPDAPPLLEVDSGCVRGIGHDGVSTLYLGIPQRRPVRVSRRPEDAVCRSRPRRGEGPIRDLQHCQRALPRQTHRRVKRIAVFLA